MSTDLKSFLSACKTLKDFENIVYVLGNESGDCDSIICSLVFAFLAYRSQNSLKGTPSIHYVPVVNNKPHVVAMRGEVAFALEKAGLSLNDLIYIDDVYQNINTVFLIDANTLPVSFKQQVSVSGIIDHHADEGLHADAEPRIINTCASCASLLIEYFSIHKFDQKLLDLLLIPLVIDSVNWTWKVTDLDIKAGRKIFNDSDLTVEQLRQKCKPLHAQISESHIDETQITVDLLLEKDLKTYRALHCLYGISVIHTSYQSINDLESGIRRFIACKHLHLHVLICTIHADDKNDNDTEAAERRQHSVQLVLTCTQPSVLDHIVTNAKDTLQLTFLESSPDKTFRCYQQARIEYSRKKLQPLLHSLLS